MLPDITQTQRVKKGRKPKQSKSMPTGWSHAHTATQCLIVSFNLSVKDII